MCSIRNLSQVGDLIFPCSIKGMSVDDLLGASFMEEDAEVSFYFMSTHFNSEHNAYCRPASRTSVLRSQRTKLKTNTEMARTTTTHHSRP